MACLQETSEAQDFYTTVGIHGNNENCGFKDVSKAKGDFYLTCTGLLSSFMI